MSTKDDNKDSRATRRFDSEKLAALTKDAGGSWQPPAATTEAEADALRAASRTSTVHDPMTMALLAAAARDSQTLEVDPSSIDAAIAQIEAEAAAATSVPREQTHPNLKRRVP